jgi:hypothetical protein
MRSDRHYPEEAPAHRVTVDSFWMDRTRHEPARRAYFVDPTRGGGDVAAQTFHTLCAEAVAHGRIAETLAAVQAGDAGRMEGVLEIHRAGQWP